MEEPKAPSKPMLFMLGLIVIFVVVVVLTWPVWLLWNYLAPTYFTFLPQAYHSIPFWDVFLLLVVIAGLRVLLAPNLTTKIFMKKD